MHISAGTGNWTQDSLVQSEGRYAALICFPIRISHTDFLQRCGDTCTAHCKRQKYVFAWCAFYGISCRYAMMETTAHHVRCLRIWERAKVCHFYIHFVSHQSLVQCQIPLNFIIINTTTSTPTGHDNHQGGTSQRNFKGVVSFHLVHSRHTVEGNPYAKSESSVYRVKV